MEYEGYVHPDEASIVSGFMYKVYGWMSFALVITATVAYYIFKTKTFFSYLTAHPGMMLLLIILQFALVFVLAFYLLRMSFSTALILFMLYSASLGVTMASIFFVYTMSSIYATFLVTAGMFGGMCLYGYFTKKDLTSIGNFAIMALLGLILATIVNFFLRSALFDYILSAVGVLIFVLLTAYDTQKIKMIGKRLISDDQGRRKFAIFGALTLYLDFINLFLFMLNFMGGRRES